MTLRTTKKIEEINKTKCTFLGGKKLNKIDKPLVRQTKKKEKISKLQMSEIKKTIL